MTTIHPLHALARLKLKLANLFGDNLAAYSLGYANLHPESDTYLDATAKAWENINQIVSKDGSTGFLPSQVIALTNPKPSVMQLALLLDDKSSPSGYSVRLIEHDFESAAEDLVMMDVELIDESSSVVLAADNRSETFDLRWLNQEQSVPRIMQRAYDATEEYKFQNISDVANCFGRYGFDISDIGMVAQAPFSPTEHSLLLMAIPDQKYPETFIIYAPYDAVLQELSTHAVEMVELPAEQEASANAGYRLAASRHFLGERLLKALRPDVSLQAPRFPDNVF